MSENKKIEKVDIESIKELRQKSSELIVKFGEVELEFIYVENRKNELNTYKDSLMKELTELQESENRKNIDN